MWFKLGKQSDGGKDGLNVVKREIVEELSIANFKLGFKFIYDIAVMKILYRVKGNEPEHWYYDVNFWILLIIIIVWFPIKL